MKVLIVANYNCGYFSPFVLEQMEALRQQGCEIDTYGVVGKGFRGYLKNLPNLRMKIQEFHPDIIHAHYGLSGLLANLQRQIPVITTFHGSDVHAGGMILFLSKIAMRLSAYNVFVCEKLRTIAGYSRYNCCILPCGINLEQFVSIEKNIARDKLGWERNKKIVLFAGAFSTVVKNAELAQQSVAMLEDVAIVEMKGFNREEVVYAMNAADCLLMTSHNEGSPMVIKEAMACGLPIVSVDVGDVKDIVGNTEGCYMAEKSTSDVSEKIEQALAFQFPTLGRNRIIELGLTNDLIADKLIHIYKQYYNIK